MSLSAACLVPSLVNTISFLSAVCLHIHCPHWIDSHVLKHWMLALTPVILMFSRFLDTSDWTGKLALLLLQRHLGFRFGCWGEAGKLQEQRGQLLTVAATFDGVISLVLFSKGSSLIEDASAWVGIASPTVGSTCEFFLVGMVIWLLTWILFSVQTHWCLLSHSSSPYQTNPPLATLSHNDYALRIWLLLGFVIGVLFA